MTRGEFVRAVIEQQKQYELMHNAEDELYHYGRKGMKWGENVFENNPITDGIDRMKAEQQKNKLLREAKKRQENPALADQKHLADMREQVRKSPNKSVYTDAYYDGDGKTKLVMEMPAGRNEIGTTRTGQYTGNQSRYGFEEIDEELVPPSQRKEYEKQSRDTKDYLKKHTGEQESDRDDTNDTKTETNDNVVRRDDVRNRHQEAAERRKALEEKMQNKKNDNTRLINNFGESRFNDYVYEGRGMDKSDRERRNNRKRNQIFHTAIKDLVDY